MGTRVRFAPSPTGTLHVGNARTALFNWLFARKEGGVFVLRVEDTDLQRSDQASVDAIVDALKWLGLDWDEGFQKGGEFGPYLQSERLDSYRGLAERLVKEGKAYHCFSTEEELEQERQAWLHSPDKRKTRHPHRDLTGEQKDRLIAEGRKASIRFAVDEAEGTVGWTDSVRGEVSVELKEIRDFNIIKSDGMPMYNFACVADDSAMKITHVIRGEDGISNTPRQLLLYRALGLTPPQFAHVSFILGPDGTKLSKRHGHTSIAEFRELGYLPEALVNYLGLLGLGGHGEGEEKFSLDELKGMFSIERIIRHAAVFDFGKLDFLNAHYLRTLDLDEVLERARPFLSDWEKAQPEAWLKEAIDVMRGNAVRLRDLPGLLLVLKADIPAIYTPEVMAMARSLKESAKAAQGLKEAFQKEGFPKTAEEARARLKTGQVLSGLKGKDFFMPARIALTGHEHGPELVRIIPLLTEKCVFRRLDSFISSLG